MLSAVVCHALLSPNHYLGLPGIAASYDPTYSNSHISASTEIILMASNYDAFYQLARAGSEMGTKLLNEAGSRMRAEDEPKIIRRENYNSGLLRPARLLDPIQRLPPEISTSIISDASRKNYPQILELTNVSQTWQRFLLSTPVLWSEVYLDDRLPDLLATVAIFVHLSNKADLKITICVGPMCNWPGLASILIPACQRITSLTITPGLYEVGYDSDGNFPYLSATSAFFDHVGRPARLRNLHISDLPPRPSVALFDSLELPFNVVLTGALLIPMTPSIQSSATPGRFFDINKYISFGSALSIEPLFNHCEIYLPDPQMRLGNNLLVVMTGETLSHLKHSNEYIQRHLLHSASSHSSNNNSQALLVTKPVTVCPALAECGLERFTRVMGTSLCRLVVEFDLSQVCDLVNFLRLLARLQVLELEIMVSEVEGPTEIAASNIVVHQLRELSVSIKSRDHLHIPFTTNGLIRQLFSVVKVLYPSVKELHFDGVAFPFLESSYLESLKTLKSLWLMPFARYRSLYDTVHDLENYPITLHSLEELVMTGPPVFHHLRMPNLLSLRLDNVTSIADFEDCDLPLLRKLTIHVDHGGSYNLNPLDYPALFEIDLRGYEALKRVDILSFSCLSSIRLNANQFTNPEGNHLCISLLCNPENCASLQEIHCGKSLEWDILFLMLERRNFGLKGIKRIHTVTLPFVPYPIYSALVLLLAGENAERPPLESISLEATRQVLFDPTVPGCCLCLKNMVPGCRYVAYERQEDDSDDDGLCLWTPDELYPEYEWQLDTVPGDIRDWMGYRRCLIDAWKSSYEEFRQGFTREEGCGRSLWF